MVYAIIIAAVLLGVVGVWLVLKSRNMQIWIGPYVIDRLTRQRPPAGAERHVYFCFVDHYEPYMLNDDDGIATGRVDNWVKQYPEIADRHGDSDGKRPQHSFFYPEEEYREPYLDKLAGLCKRGYGDVEIHMHHDNDTHEGTRNKLVSFKKILHERHGLLRRDPDSGEIIYAFIHGNWALDNSRPDGRWCGVDNELAILEQTGCYVDMTMPSAPSDTQTRKINSLYWAKGRDGHCKSHDSGRDLVAGQWKRDGELLMVQGPLMLNWQQRKLGIMPKIDSAEISGDSPPTDERIDLWSRCGISVKGAPEHIFIKVHTHGALEKNSDMLFGDGFDKLWTGLERQFRDRPGYKLHYVTAWEMVQAIKGLATGHTEQEAA